MCTNECLKSNYIQRPTNNNKNQFSAFKIYNQLSNKYTGLDMQNGKASQSSQSTF